METSRKMNDRTLAQKTGRVYSLILNRGGLRTACNTRMTFQEAEALMVETAGSLRHGDRLEVFDGFRHRVASSFDTVSRSY